MDVDSLERILQEMTGEKNVKPMMRKIAHWTKSVKNQGTYIAVDPRDVSAIEKLRPLGIFSVTAAGGVVRVSLSEKGSQLSDDFYRKAYYV